MRLKKIKFDENDPDYEIKKYLSTVRPHRSPFGIREDDMWTIISSVQKYYHNKTELLKAKLEGQYSAKTESEDQCKTK